MHELSVCRALLGQVEQVGREHGARSVAAIRLRIGPLSGVEIPLLEHAWPLAARGGLAEGAELVIKAVPVRVRCRSCGSESDVTTNRLDCPDCGDHRTQLLSGDEMLLESVELGP